MVTVEDVKNYIGIDYADDMIEKNIARMIKTSDSYLKGSIGDPYPDDDPRAEELALIIIADLYEHRDLSDRVSVNTRRLVDDMSLQLRCELRGG